MAGDCLTRKTSKNAKKCEERSEKEQNIDLCEGKYEFSGILMEKDREGRI